MAETLEEQRQELIAAAGRLPGVADYMRTFNAAMPASTVSIQAEAVRQMTMATGTNPR